MTRKEFLALTNAQYDKLSDLQSKEGFAKIWTELEGQVMHASLKKGTSADKRKKQLPCICIYWREYDSDGSSRT